MRPPSQTACPVTLWPPPFTEISRSCSRAKRIAPTTSATPAHRAIRPGRLSIMRFQTVRASSYPSSPGRRRRPDKLFAKARTAGSGSSMPPRSVVAWITALRPGARPRRPARPVARRIDHALGVTVHPVGGVGRDGVDLRAGGGREQRGRDVAPDLRGQRVQPVVGLGHGAPERGHPVVLHDHRVGGLDEVGDRPDVLLHVEVRRHDVGGLGHHVGKLEGQDSPAP